MKIIPMRDLKNTVEVEKHCIKEQGPVYVTKNGYGRWISSIMRKPCKRCMKQKLL